MGLRIRVASATLLICACGHPRDIVIKQASFDHDCPKDKIKILDEDSSIYAYRLDVCGKDRKYRDRGDGRIFQFVDVTSDPAATPPAGK